MTTLILTGIAVAGAIAYALGVGWLAAQLVRSVQRRAEREQGRHEQAEREFAAEREAWTVERSQLLDRLHYALQKPWGPSPVSEEEPKGHDRYETLQTDPGMVGEGLLLDVMD